MSRGRYAIFPETGTEVVTSDPEKPAVLDTRFFTVRTEDAGTIEIDLSSWPRAALVREFAPLIVEHVHRMGPAPLDRTLRNFIRHLRRFWGFLELTAEPLTALSDMTPAIINAYEDWLEQNAGERPNQRNLLAALICVLRVAEELQPDRLPAETFPRLSYLGHGERGASKPRNAYSSGIAAALRQAADRQVGEAESRIATGDSPPAPVLDVDRDPELRRRYNLVVDKIMTTGMASGEGVLFDNLRYHAHRCGLASPPVEDIHGGFHLTRFDIVGFLVWLSLATGMEIEALRGLKADCLRNPSRGYVEIEYRKRRAHDAQWKRLRVRDGGRATPGGVLRLAIRLTARARLHTGSDRLWVCWKPGRLSPPRALGACVAAFVQRHGLVNDEGEPLVLNLSRLRKTQRAEWYKRTNGQLEDFAIGHSIRVAAEHYADIPALRHLHEQTIVDALADAMEPALQPRIVPPADEARMRASPNLAGLPATIKQVGSFLDGENDVWLAACSGFQTSPFGRRGEACPTPFWGCLECTNAVITARKLPALIAFQSFMHEQQAMLDSGGWTAKFGRAYRRITEQILPMFSPSIVAEARLAAAASDSSLLYLPPEASAS